MSPASRQSHKKHWNDCHASHFSSPTTKRCKVVGEKLVKLIGLMIAKAVAYWQCNSVWRLSIKNCWRLTSIVGASPLTGSGPSSYIIYTLYDIIMINRKKTSLFVYRRIVDKWKFNCKLPFTVIVANWMGANTVRKWWRMLQEVLVILIGSKLFSFWISGNFGFN